MKIKHHDIVIDPERPFANCKLDREKYATILTSLVGNYADGFVLAINNEWGTGKTTFVKMWEQKLKNEGFQTLYFNAWENDFENGALAALISELSSLKDESTENLFKNVLAKGAILTKSAIPILLKSIASKYIGNDAVKELFEGVANGANELLQTQIQEYTSKKEGLKEFKASFEEFVVKSSADKPIVFIIDELDRCRPDYAVDVLEKLKHFFSVPGIVFVLSIDKIQLGNAICGVYGSENLNTNEYLRRFIDLEYTIPEPDIKLFGKYLYDYFQFDNFFFEQNRSQYRDFHYDRENFVTFSNKLFSFAKLTLRQQEKIYSHARVVLNCFPSNNYLFPTLFLFLIFLRDQHFELYGKIKAQKLTLQDLVNSFESLIPRNLSKTEMHQFFYTEAEMVCLYDNMNSYEMRELFKTDGQNHQKISLTSNINNDGNIEQVLRRLQGEPRYLEIKLSYLTDRIDLLDNFLPIRL